MWLFDLRRMFHAARGAYCRWECGAMQTTALAAACRVIRPVRRKLRQAWLLVERSGVSVDGPAEFRAYRLAGSSGNVSSDSWIAASRPGNDACTTFHTVSERTLA